MSDAGRVYHSGGSFYFSQEGRQLVTPKFSFTWKLNQMIFLVSKAGALNIFDLLVDDQYGYNENDRKEKLKYHQPFSGPQLSHRTAYNALQYSRWLETRQIQGGITSCNQSCKNGNTDKPKVKLSIG